MLMVCPEANDDKPSVRPQSYTLPPTLRTWPWNSTTNPYYRAAQAASVAWLESFHPFSKSAQSSFNKCDFSLLCALAFVKASHYNLRSCCDMMHLFFTLDEYTDTLDPLAAKVLCDATMDAMENPDKARPQGENVIGEIARQFWQRAFKNAPKVCRERFIDTWRNNVRSLVQQAERRTSSYICDIEEYMIARHDNIGTGPTFTMLEVTLEIALPHEVIQHPSIVSITKDISEIIFLSNDMYSYRKEVLANDADYNAVTILMYHNDVDVAGALQWISDRLDKTTESAMKMRDEILNHKNGFPSWGEDVDHQIALYIDGLGQFVRGHDDWFFCSERYFGTKASMIQRTRQVVIDRR